MGSQYQQSPIGIARHAWVNRPDTKYNADGLYHTELVLEGPEADAFKALVDQETVRAFEEEVAKAKEENPKFNAKGWSTYLPYEVEEDAGVPTGRVIFKFKQNALIRLRDGSTKPFVVGIRDAKNQVTDGNVFGGATIRVLYKPRNVKLATAKQFGVRLDFSMVQLIKLAPMSGGGFDEVDGGYAEGEGAEQPTKEQADY